jgi:heme-degrading monooxygenase HmoA
MFIAMNNFAVKPGQEAAFEERWRTRESYLADVDGFIHFALLRGEEAGDYASHTIWRDRAAFVAWTQSPSFAAAHRQGSVAPVLDGAPHLRLLESVMTQGAPIGGA